MMSASVRLLIDSSMKVAGRKIAKGDLITVDGAETTTDGDGQFAIAVPERAIAETRFALDAGVRGITLSPLPPASHSLTHPSLHPIYAMCAERGVPILFHVENDAPRKIARGFQQNGWDGQTDFHGGGENFTGLLYMAVSHWVEVALAALVDRLARRGFLLLDIQWVTPHLERFGAIEIPRTEYLVRLDQALARDCGFEAS